MPLPFYKPMIEVLFKINDKVSVLHDSYHQVDIVIEEKSFTLLNLSDSDKKLLLSQLREVRLEKLLNNIDVPIQVVISHIDRVGNICRRDDYEACYESNLTFNIKSKIENL
jgi:hypothetical protein